MDLIEKILEFAETQAKSVIVVLLGVIVAGGIGGGLLINSMKSNIEYKDKIINEKFSLLEERYRFRYLGLKKENIALSEQVKTLRDNLPEINESIRILNEITSKKLLNNDNSIKLLKTEIVKLEKLAHHVKESLKKSEDTASIARQIALAEPEPLPNKTYLSRKSIILKIILLIMLFIVFISLIYLVYRLYKKMKRRNEIN